LREFCFRRKRAERRERQWENGDLYYKESGRQGPPRLDER